MSTDRNRRRFLGTLLTGAVVSTRAGRAALSAENKGAAAPGGGATDRPAGKAPGGAAAPAAGGPPPSPRSAPARPAVYRARREKRGGSDGKTDRALLEAAVGAAVAGACGEAAAGAGLRRLFRPNDVVGIKVNCIAGKGLSTRPEIVALLIRWLQEAGLPARNIVVWDRTDRELRNAGFELNRSGDGARVFGTNDDYEWKPREWGPNGSCFPRLLVEDLTALINVGVLKDHGLAGISGGMKSWYGAIQNPNKCHDDNCAPFIPHLAAFPLIHDKLRLTLMDAVTAQCEGGPGRSPKWIWPYQGILASTDPVAIDALCARIIEDRRREVGLPTLAAEKRVPRWIEGAAKLGIGEADLARVRVQEA
jgi:uncharacterized protein (DUF362 family)